MPRSATRCSREGMRMDIFVWLGGLVSLGLLGYLVFALLFPEKLS